MRLDGRIPDQWRWFLCGALLSRASKVLSHRVATCAASGLRMFMLFARQRSSQLVRSRLRPAFRSCRCESYRTGAIAGLIFVSVAVPCAAQSNAGAFLGGDLLFVRTSNPPPDPPGGGYLVPYYYGTLEWPVAGVRADAGGFIARRWSLGAEFLWRASASGAITEESHGHTDRQVISSTFTSRESLVSAIVRFHARPDGPVDLQPAGGFTIAISEQSLTNRQGISYDPGFAPFPYPRPDVAERRTRWGLVGGADAVFRVHPHVSIVATGRLHWIRRDNPDPYTRTVPGVGTFVLQIGGGVRWQSRR